MTSALDVLWEQGRAVTSGLSEPAYFIFDPSKRIFWGYLLGSLLIAGVVGAFQKRGGASWLGLLYQNLLSPRIWLHPSSLLDLKLMFAKSLFKAVVVIPWLFSAYGLALGVVRLASDTLGPAEPMAWHDSTVTMLYTVVLFTSSDLSRYVLHRLCHKIPLLWQFHQVHHSAEVMTPLTLYRSHPIEGLLYFVRGVSVTGMITGLFFYFFGAQTIQLQFLGVNILGLLFNMLGANLRHSHVWISYGPIIERIFLSPAQHQTHHSALPHHHNTNFGSCLALWDQLAGSLRIAHKQDDVVYGLPHQQSNHHPHKLTSALVGPLVASVKLVAKNMKLGRNPIQLEGEITAPRDEAST